MLCPNKNHPSFKNLVEEYGEDLAYYHWAVQTLEGETPQEDLPVKEKPRRPAPSFAVFNGEQIFQDATKDLETGKYVDNSGEQFDSVTGDVIKSMQTKPFTATDTYGTRSADKLWDGIEPDVKLKIDGFVVPVTKQEYIDFIDRNMSKGMAKGEILHAKVSEYITKNAELRSRINELMAENNILPIEIDWINDDVVRTIIEKTGTDYLQDGGTDRLYSEKVIGSKLLKWFGTVDMFVDHGDDLYSIFDMKTGLRFNRIFEDSFLKYGSTSTEDIFDTARNRAKLQLMLYAFIVKTENPKARFRNLDVIYIKNQWSLAKDDLYKSVNVPAYLEIIQKTLKYENKELYKKLEELPHFKQLFDPASYTTVTRQSFEDKFAKASSADILKAKTLELQGLIMYDSSIRDLNAGLTEEALKRRKRISELMGEIIELKKDPSVNMDITSVNMGWMDRWLGSQTYSTNPYVQLYHKELSKAKQAARNQYETWAHKHDALLKKLIDKKGLKSVSRLIGGVDRNKLFGNLYVNKPDETTKVIKRLITSADEEEWNNLLQEERDYLTYIQNSISGVFEDTHADMVDSSNKTPLAKRVVTYRDWHGKKDIPVTNLDLHNKKYSIHNLDTTKQPFKYYRGFFPKMMPQLDDIQRKHGGVFNEGMIKFIWNRYTTNFFESEYEQWENRDEAIPMKYLGNSFIDDNYNYTLNLESSVKGFMKHSIYKAKMDEVYTIGQAMKIYLDSKKELLNAGPDPDKVNHANRLINWFEDSINLHILGRKNLNLTASSRNFGIIRNDTYQKFSWTKFLRSLKGFFAGPTMWLKPLSGLPNAVFASLVTIKEGIKGSLKLSTSNAKFTLSDIASGFGEAFKLFFWNGLSNDSFRHNKAYLLMEKFGYLPENSDWYTNTNELMTARNQLFTSRSMMVFHSVPEETIATAIFVAQLKAMKFKNEQGVETNVWDSYKEVTEKLDDGTPYTSIEWVGGVRGKVRASNISGDKDYEEVKGLTNEEINAIKFLYEKIHGGYRGDERTAAEYYVMGELFIQMKRYIPAILKNVWASRGLRQTQGFYEEVIDENGEKILKWKPQIIEGRYRVIARLLLNYLSIKHTTTDGKKGNRFKEMLGLQFDDNQSWEKLSDAQKEDIQDFILTTTMYLMLIIGRMKLWDEDDDDTMKKLYTRVANDFAGNVNPLEILKNVKNATMPTAANRGYQLLEGLTQLTWATMLYSAGYTDDALTQEGNFRGSANVKRNLHFISAWYDIMHGAENSELFKEYLK